MSYDVRRVANAILHLARERRLPVTNMALNKLTYFAHAWHLATMNEPLVDSYFEAWQYGPVHPTLYRQFRIFADTAITSHATRVDLLTGHQVPIEHDLPCRQEVHLQRIVDFYGPLNANRLSAISHELGAPWDVVWHGAGSRPGMKISDDLTKSYYKAKLEKRN